MNKLRIGIILNGSYKPEEGGGFSYYDWLISAIDNYSFNSDLEFVFITLADPGANPFKKDLVKINPWKGYSIREKSVINLTKVFRRLPLIKLMSVTAGLQKKSADIREKKITRELIDAGIELLYFPVPFSQFLNYPHVETHWDIGHYSMFPFPEVALNGTFAVREKYYAENVLNAFAVFCESVSGMEELLYYKKINPQRVFMVPLFPGKVTSLSLSQESMQQHLNTFALKQYRFFFYPAQFWAHKNHYTLLLAFKQLVADFPDVKLVLSGSDKGNMQYIKSVIKSEGLEAQVVITGFVSNEAIYTFYKSAAALVMPTFLGPTNMPLLEAQEIGCPVICSDLKGHRELLTGIQHKFVEPDNADALYTGMKSMLEHPPERKGQVSEIFNIKNSLHCMEQAFIKIKKLRKTFGVDFTGM
jgi:glycosyltransferase involved in cell wall biosynthesis